MDRVRATQTRDQQELSTRMLGASALASNAKAGSVSLFFGADLRAFGVLSWPLREPTTLYGRAARGRLSGLTAPMNEKILPPFAFF